MRDNVSHERTDIDTEGTNKVTDSESGAKETNGGGGGSLSLGRALGRSISPMCHIKLLPLPAL